MMEWFKRLRAMHEGRFDASTTGRRAPAGASNGDAGGYDEPPIGSAPQDDDVRWEFIFSVFLRLIAIIWMLKGFTNWALILGLGDLPLVEETPLRQAIIIGFAILNCSAAVGLWLLTPWGKSLWAFLAIVEVVLGTTGYGQSVSMVAASATFFITLLFLMLSFAVRYTNR